MVIQDQIASVLLIPEPFTYIDRPLRHRHESTAAIPGGSAVDRHNVAGISVAVSDCLSSVSQPAHIVAEGPYGLRQKHQYHRKRDRRSRQAPSGTGCQS